MGSIPDKLISAYLEGQLDQAQAAELSQWVRASKDHALYLASLTALEHSLVKLARTQSNSDILAELQQAEDAAAIVAFPRDETRAPIDTKHADTVTRHQVASALAYVVKHTFTPKRVAMLASAAAVLLGIVLAIVLMTSPDTTEPIADNTPPNKPAESAQPILRDTPVATLTNTHNAQWAEGALAPGSNLQAGTRLTLTAGFAEITTNDGAVAILEAPATIELLDNENALHLHAGKLVGICETESSKGFLVRTSHMDITDLGTRFGVDATRPDRTEVHVFHGEVQVASTTPPATGVHQLHRLAAGQSARANATNSEILTTEHDSSKFAALKPVTFPLPGSGVGLAIGDSDPNWRLISENGQPVPGREAMMVTDYPGLVKSGANDPARAQWLVASATLAPTDDQPIPYVIETTFDIPESIAPGSARLVIDCIADNHLIAVDINDHRLSIEALTDDANPETLVIEEHLHAGKNTIRFVVTNISPFKGANANFSPEGILIDNPVGLRLSWALHGTTTLFRQ